MLFAAPLLSSAFFRVAWEISSPARAFPLWSFAARKTIERFIEISNYRKLPISHNLTKFENLNAKCLKTFKRKVVVGTWVSFLLYERAKHRSSTRLYAVIPRSRSQSRIDRGGLRDVKRRWRLYAYTRLFVRSSVMSRGRTSAYAAAYRAKINQHIAI